MDCLDLGPFNDLRAGALWEYGFAYTVCRRAIFYYGHGPAGDSEQGQAPFLE